MALQGTIETFALPDVLRLLASSKKTGRLRVSGSRGSGSVWVESGGIVASDATGAPHAASHVDVVFELLRYRDGSFTFENDRHAPDPGPSHEIDPVLVDAELQLAEWREIESVIPSVDCQVRLVSELPRADVVVDADRWRVLVAVAGGTTVSSVGEALGMGELAVSRAVRDLVESGLADVTDPDAAAGGDAPEPAVAAAPEPVPEPAAEPAPSEPEPEAATPPTPEPPPEPDTVLVLDEADDDEDDEPVGRSARAELDALTSGYGFEDRNQPPPVDVAGPEPGAADRSSTNGHGPTDGAPGDGGFDALGPAPFGSQDLFASPPSGGDPLFADSSGPDPLFADPNPPAPPPPPPPPPAGADGADGDAGEVARQLANLSPKAARAVAAAARADSDEEREAFLSEAVGEDDEPLNRNLLLKFLSAQD